MQNGAYRPRWKHVSSACALASSILLGAAPGNAQYGPEQDLTEDLPEQRPTGTGDSTQTTAPPARPPS